MNKEYKAAIDRAVWNVLPSEINISNATVGRIHRKILAAVWDYLHENPVKYDAALQSQLLNIARAYAASLQESEIALNLKETFTARDARSATVKARTYEGFLRNVMEDIEYQTRGGLNTMTVIKYSNDYKVEYFPRLTKFLRSIGYEVTQTEVLESRRGTARIRVKLSIYW